MEEPLISIITVTYNAQAYVLRTMQSVFVQDMPGIEYIIMDGKSKDDTMGIVNEYRDKVSIVISEPDKGIYDAMNKALAIATGKYVLFLNAGDELYDNHTLSRIFATAVDADVYYGNTSVMNESGEDLGDRRLSPPDHLTWKSLQYGMCVSHQSFIARRVLCGSYDPRYRISADIDWTIRVLKKSARIVNVHGYVSRFLTGGASAVRRRQGLKERWQILVRHYGLLKTVINHLYIAFRFVWHRISRKSMT